MISDHRRPPASWLAVATTTTVLLSLALCCSLPRADAFAHVPTLRYYALTLPDASTKHAAARACAISGGYLAAEPTSAAHEAAVQAAQKLAPGRRWFAHLGASTTGSVGSDGLFCQPGARLVDKNNPTYEGNRPPTDLPYDKEVCYYRWNEGRWLDMMDDTTLRYYTPNVGVTFHRGTTSASKNPISFGATGGFASYFLVNQGEWDRPGELYSNHVVSVGNDTGAFWSDNEDAYGYLYENYVYGSQKADDAAIAASGKDFIVLCNTQAPTRDRDELTNTTSQIQEHWWAVLFSILFVVCFIVFLIVVCCQEREDMDEPPEDAPEWAVKEADSTVRSRSFMSHTSFRDHGEDAYEDLDEQEDVRGGNNNDNNNVEQFQRSASGSYADNDNYYN